MTEREAIEKIRWRIETASHIAGKGEDGKAFEDLEIAINALEKQVAKKPNFLHNMSDYVSLFECGCGNRIKIKHDCGIMDNNDAPNFCSNCGCRLDWSE